MIKPCASLPKVVIGRALVLAVVLIVLVAFRLDQPWPVFAFQPMRSSPQHQQAPGGEVGSRNRIKAPGVVEYLLLSVPADQRQTWIAAERSSWEPWLKQQLGFLGRDLYWDQKRQQGVVVIQWASQAAWDGIAEEEVNRVQAQFERLARSRLGLQTGNPFPIIQSSSLVPQDLSPEP
jgi:uncharacterized protein (TIGR03792 family)